MSIHLVGAITLGVVVCACVAAGGAVGRHWCHERTLRLVEGWRKLAKGLLWFLCPLWILVVFVGEPFIVPTGSMIPTIKVGDVILVNKMAYGIHVPWTQWTLFKTGRPHRGDVVVFHFPGYTCLVKGHWVRTGDRTCTHVSVPVPHQDWVKRVVAVPSDAIEMHGRHLVINGVPVKHVQLGAFKGNPEIQADRLLMNHQARVWREYLPGAVHRIIRMDGYDSPGSLPSSLIPKVVPKGCYVVMGDDRNNSIDSRWWGCVPAKDLVGKATFIAFRLALGHVSLKHTGERL